MLYISKEDEIPLDKKFHRIHNLCAIIYDQLTEIFSGDDYSELNSTKFNLDHDKHKDIEKFNKGEIHALEWLKINNLNKEISQVLVKHVTMSVLSDFVNFIYESLSCAMRGKMTIAYALLRKPFTDELLIFEQILDNQDDFVNRFFHDGDPLTYDPSDRKIDKRKIIENALKKSKPNIVFTSDLIYDLRYEKSLGKGINGMSNHALHIVTRDKNYKTTKQNLNFVFSTKEDIKSYWENYYFFVPYLLIYSVSVVDNILSQFLTEKKNKHLLNTKVMIRFISILLWSEFQGEKETKNKKIFQVLTQNLNLICDKCNSNVELERADFELFVETSTFLCPKCFNSLINSSSAIQELNRFVELLKS
ncbi:hypothetical protein [Joostella sp.]|uniref:hypothetical protein n=1 Tax=Joostella sp. TaxID=2231138 RepID=UPI003A9082E4